MGDSEKVTKWAAVLGKMDGEEAPVRGPVEGEGGGEEGERGECGRGGGGEGEGREWWGGNGGEGRGMKRERGEGEFGGERGRRRGFN